MRFLGFLMLVIVVALVFGCQPIDHAVVDTSSTRANQPWAESYTALVPMEYGKFVGCRGDDSNRCGFENKEGTIKFVYIPYMTDSIVRTK